MALCIWISGGTTIAATVSAVAVDGKSDKITEKPIYSEIYEKNVFDPKRQAWAEKVDPPPPPPAVPPLTPADAEVYGVMAFGDFKKAIIKLGAGFKYAPQPKNKSAPRPFVILGIGESLGPYTIKEITDKSVVFESGGAQFPLAFNHKKSDRPAGGSISPMAQAPVILSAPTPTIVQGIEPLAAATTPAPPQVVPSSPQPAAQAAPQQAQAATPEPSAAAQQPAIQGMTLLDAINAARQAQQAGVAPAASPFVIKK